MKAVAPLFFGLLHMAGCSVGKPSLADVSTIEALTQKNACIGSLQRWHRLFAFQQRGSRVDRNFISVTYVQAGHRGLPAGREVAEPGWPSGLDDEQFRSAGGTYDRARRRLTDWQCGCNFPPYNVDHQIACGASGS